MDLHTRAQLIATETARKKYLLYKEEAFAADGTDLHSLWEAVLFVYSVWFSECVIHLLILRIQTLIDWSVLLLENEMIVQITHKTCC